MTCYVAAFPPFLVLTLAYNYEKQFQKSVHNKIHMKYKKFGQTLSEKMERMMVEMDVRGVTER